ncbi:MAG: RsmB/NOP family class I SAM-dependent RNA methyltransferase [Rhodospirillales bacterium]
MPGAYFRKRRYAGSKDRRAVTERLFKILRNRARLDWWIVRANAQVEPSPRARVLADLMLRDRLDESAAAALFGGTQYAPAPLSPVERGLAASLEGQPFDHPTMPAWVRGECPEWLDAPLRELYGERFEAELAALNEPAPLDARVNIFRGSREEIRTALREQGVESKPARFSPVGLRIEGHPRLTHTPAYKDGLIEVQDEGSQLAALMAEPEPRHTVIDFCAGAGGKTLALVDAMIRDGRFDGLLWACDTIPSRLAELEKRARRAGVHEAILIHAFTENDPWLGENEACADRVLLDVPCSGTGAWRREPEAKGRLTEQSVGAFVVLQRRILERAATLVKPGGRLIYVTCSILSAENEEQIAWFLEAAPAFSARPAGPIWQRVTGAEAPVETPFVRLSPAATGTDGFFIAVLERSK